MEYCQKTVLLVIFIVTMSWCTVRAEELSPLAFEPLSLGSVHPAGWLKRQLTIQATGLSGHLDEFWPDLKDSAWMGGRSEGWSAPRTGSTASSRWRS